MRKICFTIFATKRDCWFGRILCLPAHFTLETKHFSSRSSREAAFQIKRLAHHASLALWCGNNELEQKPDEIQKTEERQRAYEVLFYDLLPETVAAWDGTTAYWPSSPHNPAGYGARPKQRKAAATPISGTFGISGNQPSIMRNRSLAFAPSSGCSPTARLR